MTTFTAKQLELHAAFDMIHAELDELRGLLTSIHDERIIQAFRQSEVKILRAIRKIRLEEDVPYSVDTEVVDDC